MGFFKSRKVPECDHVPAEVTTWQAKAHQDDHILRFERGTSILCKVCSAVLVPYTWEEDEVLPEEGFSHNGNFQGVPPITQLYWQ